MPHPQHRQKAMKILVSPSGFKESVEPHIAADCIEEGILRVVPNAVVQRLPLVDGGEGFASALVGATGGELKYLDVTGPVKTLIHSHYGFLGRDSPKTAVIEMAAAAGLSLVPRDIRDPTTTTTYGVGETIVAALNEGAQHILVGCGDSGTSDGGAGMAQALGARFLDADGNGLPRASGGANLSKLAAIDLSGLHPRLKEVKIDAACNWQNVLCGPKGVARVFGPQNGATPKQVETLATALDNYASVVERRLQFDVSRAPGSGASGGLGTGLMLIGAQLHPRYEMIMKYFDLDKLLDDCQLVFTAEGGIDFQAPLGEVPAEVARRAKRRGLPVIALAGTHNAAPTSLEDAIRDTERLLKDSAEGVMRMVMVGTQLKDDHPAQVFSVSSADSTISNSDVPMVAAKLAAMPIPILKAIKVPEAPHRALDAKVKEQSLFVTT